MVMETVIVTRIVEINYWV